MQQDDITRDGFPVCAKMARNLVDVGLAKDLLQRVIMCYNHPAAEQADRVAQSTGVGGRLTERGHHIPGAVLSPGRRRSAATDSGCRCNAVRHGARLTADLVHRPTVSLVGNTP